MCSRSHRSLSQSEAGPIKENKKSRIWQESSKKILDNEIEKCEVVFMNIVTGNADQSLKSVVYNINWLITSHKPGHPCIGQCIVCSGTSTVITKY